MPACLDARQRSEFIWVGHLHHHRASDHVIQRPVIELVAGLKVEELFVGADGLQQLDDVVGVESAGLCGHAAGQIRVADVRHALMDVQLSRFSGLDVSSGLRRQIHHHRPVTHALHHLTLDQHWSSFT